MRNDSRVHESVRLDRSNDEWERGGTCPNMASDYPTVIGTESELSQRINKCPVSAKKQPGSTDNWVRRNGK